MPNNIRRRDTRFKRSVAFRMIPSGITNKAAIDISLGGLLMQSSKLYNVNQMLPLEIIIPKQESIYCDAKVAWVYPKTRSATNYKIGLQFLNLSTNDRERLKNYLES